MQHLARRRFRAAAPIAAAAALVAIALSPALGDEPAEPEPRLSFHIVDASTPECEVTGDHLTCADIRTMGHAGTAQRLYVIVTGVPSLYSVQFGIDYDDGVTLGRWTPCISGLEQATESWPERKSGLGMIWTRCLEPRGPDGMIVLGYIDVPPTAWGRVWFTHYMAAVDASAMICQDSATPTIPILSPEEQGMVRVHGVHPGRCGCPPDEAPRDAAGESED